jgi:hypothetical protein
MQNLTASLVICLASACCLGQIQIGVSEPGPFWSESGEEGNPADGFIAASLDGVGVVDNQYMRFYDKTLTAFDEINLETFFGNTGGYDPRILWDDSLEDQVIRDQFVVTSFNGGMVKLRASIPGQFPLIPDNWEASVEVGPILNEWSGCGPTGILAVDRPGLGYSQDAWVISAMTQNAAMPIDYINNMFYVVDKDTFAVTGPIGSEVFVSTEAPKTLGCFQKTGLPGLEGRESAYPARQYGESPALYSVGAAAYLKSRDGSGAGPPCGRGFKYLRIFAVTGAPTQSMNFQFYDLEVPACYIPEVNNVPDNNEEGVTFRATDGRIVAAEWREVNGVPLLFVCHEIQDTVPIESESMNYAQQARIRWYVIQTNGWPISGQNPTLWQWDDIEHGVVEVEPGEERPVHTVYPAMAVDDDGDMGFVFALTSVDQKLTVNATIRSYPLYLLEPTVHAAESLNTAPMPGDAFGDYFGVCVDPVDGSFWGIGSYVSNEPNCDPPNVLCRWATQVFNFFN